MTDWSRWFHSPKKGKSLKDIQEEGNLSAVLPGGPAERARQLGLQSNGRGSYIDPNTGQVAARTVNGELVFYDNNGGAIADSSGGSQLSRAQPSWGDPITGMLVTPPGKAESPAEIASIPDAVPATPPAGYNDFMKRKKDQAYQINAIAPQPMRMTPDEEQEQQQQQQDMTPDQGQAFGEGFGDVAKRMAAAYERNKDRIAKKLGAEQKSRDKATEKSVKDGDYKPQALLGRTGGLPQPTIPQNVQRARETFGQPQQSQPKPQVPTPSKPQNDKQDIFSGPAFTSDYPTSDEDFHRDITERGLGNGTDFVNLGGLLKSPIKGINPKYLRALSRGLALNKSNDTKDWSLVSEGQGGGAGENASRYGELMSLIMSVADDEQVGALEKGIRSAIRASNGDTHVDESWLDAALQNRKGVQRLLKFENDDNPSVMGGAWDVADELEALGIGTEGGEKKGFSTDEVIRDSNNRNYQISLKKGGANRLLNSTAANYGKMMMDGIRENGTDEQKQLVAQYDERLEDFKGIYKSINNSDYKGIIGSTPSLTKIRQTFGVNNDEAREIRKKWEEFKEMDSTFGDQFVDDKISSSKFINDMNSDLLKGYEDNKEELSNFDLNERQFDLAENFEELLKQSGIDMKDLKSRFYNNGKLRNTPLQPRKNDNIDNYNKIKELLQTAKTNGDNTTALNEVLKNIRKKYPGMNAGEMLETLMSGGGDQRGKNKILYQLLSNTKNGQSFRDAASNRNKEFTRNAMSEISNNPIMRSGVLQSIRNNFPLKDVADGSESMVIGDSVLSKRVLKEFFGTDDYNSIKDNLKVVNPEDGSDPYLAYNAMTDPMNIGEFEEIPIADIGVRQDGVGYGPTIKHEMTMRADFFKKLQAINQKLDTNLTAEEVLGIVFNKHMIV